MKTSEYVGKRCWQCRTFTSIRFGIVEECIESEGWVLLLVKWDGGSSEWEKIVNISFSLPKEASDLIQ